MQESKLVPFSEGIVAENKPLNTRDIEVTPTEVLTMVDGELTEGSEKQTAKGVDAGGKSYENEARTSNTVKATWLPLGSSNRHTAPDVRRGERVLLWRFADSDRYWWTILTDDLKLRKLETAIYVWSGTKDEAKDVGPDTHYFLEISTHKGLVRFHTSSANGEATTFDFEINTKEGIAQLVDGLSNYFYINSKNAEVKFGNSDGSFVHVIKNSIFQEATELISLKSAKILLDGEVKATKNIKAEIQVSAGAGFRNSNPENGAGNGGSTMYGDTTINNGNLIINGKIIWNGVSYSGTLADTQGEGENWQQG